MPMYGAMMKTFEKTTKKRVRKKSVAWKSSFQDLKFRNLLLAKENQGLGWENEGGMLCMIN